MRRFARLFGVLATGALVAGCGLLGDNTAPASSTNTEGPELQTVRLAVLPLIDIAPLHYGMDRGYFREVGLDLKPTDLVTVASGGDAVNKMIAGEVEIAYSSWTPFLVAMSKGAQDVRLVAAASDLGPLNSPIMIGPNSSVHSVRDLAGKRIGATAPNTASQLLTASALKVNGVDPNVNGVDPNGVQWVFAGFPELTEMVVTGQIDATYEAEPWRVVAERRGAVAVYDTNDGPTNGMPLSGYGALAPWVDKHPRTVEAFQRALLKSAQELARDRSLLEATCTRFLSKFDAETFKLAKMNPLQVGNITPTGIHRVEDLMLEFHALQAPIPGLDSHIQPYPTPGGY